MDSPHKKLHKDHILTPEQFEYLDKIKSKKLVSLHFELRSLLYIGVLLLSTGIGLLIYINMGNWSHLALIVGLLLLESACIYYISIHILPFSNQSQKPPTPYFDYVTLLGALVFISIFTYILIQYDLIEEMIQWSSLITAILFSYLAFRLDHRGVLSLAITAFAAFWGLQVSFVQWTQSDFTSFHNIYLTGIGIGLFLTSISYGLGIKKIKPHFIFTFKSFGLLFYFTSIISASFDNNYWVGYALLGIISGGFISIDSWKKQEYLFFVMAIITSYILFTRLLFEVSSDFPFQLWMIYFMASMGGLVFMITRIIKDKKKNNQL
jgi:hypothetical protein